MWTYSKAGVDIRKVGRVQGVLKRSLEKTLKLRKGIILGPGHYAGLIDLGDKRALALHTDGVGTKVIVAQMMEKYDTIGIDCIAMNVNDIICVGAEPIAFTDYLALAKPNLKVTREIAKGLAEGAKRAKVAIVGGETAIVPDLLKDEKTFDLAGTAVGLVEKDGIVSGERLDVEDVIIGIESSGLHSSGYTLARKVLLENHGIYDYLPSLGRTLGEELLEPTRIYVKPLLECIKQDVTMRGIAHITGGGFAKLKRLCKRKALGFSLEKIPKPTPIFKLIQKAGRISDVEMYRTYNMGIGMCVMTSKSEVDRIVECFRKYDMDCHEVGKTMGSEGVYVGNKRVD